MQISLTRSSVMATSAQHVFTSAYFSLTHSHGCTYSPYIKQNCKLTGNACKCPHYVFKTPQFECSSGVLQGIYLFYRGVSLCISTQGTITLVCEHHSLLSDPQLGSHHARAASLSAVREANTGQRKRGVISDMWLSEEICTSPATVL